MSLQVEKMEKNMARLTIEVSAEDLDKAMQNNIKRKDGKHYEQSIYFFRRWF